MTAQSRPEVSPVSGQIVCFRLTGPLCTGTADALLDAVSDRTRAATPAVCAVVLDLSDTPDIDDGTREALLSLCDLLEKSHARLRLVLPEPEARAGLCDEGAANAIGPDAFHTSVRAAILAAHAELPGPALVTPAMRALLMRPPELLHLRR